MSDLASIRAAGKRVQRAEEDLAAARATLRKAIVAAHTDGNLSMLKIGEELGVSRQRVAQILEEEKRGQ